MAKRERDRKPDDPANAEAGGELPALTGVAPADEALAAEPELAAAEAEETPAPEPGADVMVAAAQPVAAAEITDLVVLVVLKYDGEIPVASFPVRTPTGIRYVPARKGQKTEPLEGPIAAQLLASGKGFTIANERGSSEASTGETQPRQD